ncbi:MAG TPA: ATPase [Gemmataceae bacterium]|jgi:predicted ATPase with chaperone activity|nr:ATPase [Gemmataceae bacterium]HEV3446202.1 ATPase [Gemmataceae bacterium]
MIRAAKQYGMEWDGAGLPEAPTAPETIKESGLTAGFLNDMILRTLYTLGGMLGLEMSRYLCLPFKVIEESLVFLKDEKCLEVTGGDLIGRISYRFNLTDLGRRRAQDAMKLCAYIGPAPVPLEDYIEQVYRQAVTGIQCTPEVLRGSFSHLVITEDLFNAIGPAVVSGRSVFIYGPPGNGKTSIARSIGEFMNNSGGEIYVPYAFLAENSIITVYDQALHQLSDRSDLDQGEDNEATIRRLLNTGTVDARWVRIRRPVVITGGELNLDMLDLRYNAEANFYQAPLHVKANGGIFLIDDFGRQLCSPKELLNRWILPLEDRHDFLTLSSGKKFEVPFEQLTIFSTNLDPKDLVDDAFLRRIRHKVGILAPEREVYQRIFNAMVKKLGMNPCPEAVDFLYERYYNNGRSPRASDCRDLLETVQSICRYRRQPVQLNRELMVEAAASFICEF